MPLPNYNKWAVALVLYGTSVILLLHHSLWNFSLMFIGIGVMWQLIDDARVFYAGESKSRCSSMEGTISMDMDDEEGGGRPCATTAANKRKQNRNRQRETH